MSIPAVIVSAKTHKQPISIQDTKSKSKKVDVKPIIIELEEAGLKGKSQKSSEAVVIAKADMKSSKSEKIPQATRSANPVRPAESNEYTSYIEMRSVPVASTSSVNAADESDDASSASVIASCIAVSVGSLVVAAIGAF